MMLSCVPHRQCLGRSWDATRMLPLWHLTTWCHRVCPRCISTLRLWTNRTSHCVPGGRRHSLTDMCRSVPIRCRSWSACHADVGSTKSVRHMSISCRRPADPRLQGAVTSRPHTVPDLCPSSRHTFPYPPRLNSARY